MARRRTEIEIKAKDKASLAYKNVRGQSEQLSKSTKGLRSSYANLGGTITKFLPMLSGAAIIGGFGKMIKMTADAGDKYAKMSQKLGVAVETLSTFDHVAKLSGITIDVVGVGLRRFAQNAMDMSRGIGEAKREFEALGLEVLDSSGNIREMEDLMLEVADRFAEMEDGTAKTAMAMRLFGRSGSEMIPMLNQGREGLKGMMEEARNLGLVFSEESAKAMEEFNDNLTRLRGNIVGLTKWIGTNTIPVLNDFLEMILRIAGVERPINKIRGMTVLLEHWEGKVEELTESLKRQEEQEWKNENMIAYLKKELEFAKQTVADYTAQLNGMVETQKVAGRTFEDIAESSTKATEGITRVADALTLGAWYEAHENAILYGEGLAKAAEEERLLEEAITRRLEAQEREHEATQNMILFGEETKKVKEQSQELTNVTREVSHSFLAAGAAAVQSGTGIKGMLKSVGATLAAMAIGKTAEQIAEGFADIAASIWPPNPLAAAAAKAHFAAAAKWGIAGALATAVASIGHEGIEKIKPDERLILAQTGEGLLSRRGVEAIGGPGVISGLNRGDVSIAMTNNFGGINNIMDVGEMAELMGNQIVTEIREAG